MTDKKKEQRAKVIYTATIYYDLRPLSFDIGSFWGCNGVSISTIVLAQFVRGQINVSISFHGSDRKFAIIYFSNETKIS